MNCFQTLPSISTYSAPTHWVENELHPDPLKRPVDPAAGTDRPAFEVAAKCAPSFEPDPAFFASVHFVDDALAQEMVGATG